MICSVFIGLSLDGFIAGKDGSIDWLTEHGGPDSLDGPGEDYGYREFFSSVDAMVIGRNSFLTVLGFGNWPYEDKKVLVMSRTLSGSDIPDELRNRVSVTSRDAEGVYAELKAQGARRLYVDGGLTIQGFLRAGRINDMTLTRIPILLGEGVPLFGPLPRYVRWEHIETSAYPSGLVQSRYRVSGARP
jgi:dihydrofolate reductase